MENGISGKIAGAFIKSKLSILLMFAFMLLGLFSIYFIPREEEPQIEVPMADIMIGYPGGNTSGSRIGSNTTYRKDHFEYQRGGRACIFYLYEWYGYAYCTILCG